MGRYPPSSYPSQYNISGTPNLEKLPIASDTREELGMVHSGSQVCRGLIEAVDRPKKKKYHRLDDVVGMVCVISVSVMVRRNDRSITGERSSVTKFDLSVDRLM